MSKLKASGAHKTSDSHRISLHQTKVWTVEQVSDQWIFARHFGAPETLRRAKSTMFCIEGNSLPDRMVFNGMEVDLRPIRSGVLGAEITTFLLGRNKVDLIWQGEVGRDSSEQLLASLSAVYLEISE